MKFTINLLFVCFCVFSASSPIVAQNSQTPKAIVTRESGGSIQTPLGYNIVLNKESSLMREWITVHDQTLPASLAGTVGIKTAYESGRVSGEYRYKTSFTIEAKEPLAALEVRFLLFDLWGNHIKTLSLTEVADIPSKKEHTGEWRAFSENEVSEFYASIAYLARVRTQSGRVMEANPTAVIEEARKFSKKFSAEALEPKTETK